MFDQISIHLKSLLKQLQLADICEDSGRNRGKAFDIKHN